MNERKEMERRARVVRSSKYLEEMERQKAAAEVKILEKEAYLLLQDRLKRLEHLEKQLKKGEK